ncbi:MAG: 30S ribosomal protein S20 [Parcubacteria group bacterium SW_4_49_11]|nr:MAG: 30S ribosomal protein S20 [Parcubacteria group bacterium SW_4_49_11]
MPNTKSAHKAKRQQDRRRSENNRVKRQMKDAQKDFEVAVSDTEKEQEDVPVKQYQQKIDKAAKQRVIDENKAARMKNNMMKDLKQRKDFEDENKE